MGIQPPQMTARRDLFYLFSVFLSPFFFIPFFNVNQPTGEEEATSAASGEGLSVRKRCTIGIIQWTSI